MGQMSPILYDKVWQYSLYISLFQWCKCWICSKIPYTENVFNIHPSTRHLPSTGWWPELPGAYPRYYRAWGRGHQTQDSSASQGTQRPVMMNSLRCMRPLYLKETLTKGEQENFTPTEPEVALKHTTLEARGTGAMHWVTTGISWQHLKRTKTSAHPA